MENSSADGSRKKKLVKIIVPLLILVAIGGVWFAKNGGNASSGASELEAGAHPDFVLEVTEELDIEALKTYGLPILIDFGADSCAPCKDMAPILEKLNQELRGKAIIKFVDVWKYPELADGIPIRVIPSQIFIDAEGNPFTPADSQASAMIMHGNPETREHFFTVHEGGMTEEMMLAALGEMGVEP